MSLDLEKPRVTGRMKALSLGAGVQSTALLLMALHGEFGERPDVALFADTGWEPRAVYDHLRWLTGYAASMGFPILTVPAGNIREDTLRAQQGGRGGFAAMPFAVANMEGQKAKLKRQCTREYKVTPIQRQLRALVGRRGTADLWLGISLDEYHRMKDSRVKWITHRYPLVDHRLTRADCMIWLQRNGYSVPPKSSCIGCPLHSNHVWREMKLTDPQSWAEAVAFDEHIRHLPRINGEVFLHRSLKPLVMVDLREDQADLWGEECEGHCGV